MLPCYEECTSLTHLMHSILTMRMLSLTLSQGYVDGAFHHIRVPICAHVSGHRCNWSNLICCRSLSNQLVRVLAILDTNISHVAQTVPNPLHWQVSYYLRLAIKCCWYLNIHIGGGFPMIDPVGWAASVMVWRNLQLLLQYCRGQYCKPPHEAVDWTMATKK